MRRFTVPNKGDKLVLNCGYGGGPDETDCVIESVFNSSGLFDKSIHICATVRIVGTNETFDTELT
jgi:hypothetical protein